MPDRLVIDDPEAHGRRVRARLVWWQFSLGVAAWFLVFVHAAKTVEISKDLDRKLTTYQTSMDEFRHKLRTTDSAIKAIVNARLRLQIQIARKVGVPESEISDALMEDNREISEGLAPE